MLTLNNNTEILCLPDRKSLNFRQEKADLRLRRVYLCLGEEFLLLSASNLFLSQSWAPTQKKNPVVILGSEPIFREEQEENRCCLPSEIPKSPGTSPQPPRRKTKRIPDFFFTMEFPKLLLSDSSCHSSKIKPAFKGIF